MKSYDNLVGVFKNLAENNKLSHSYIFYGGEQKEKIIFARSLANFLENKDFQDPKQLLKEALIIESDEKNTIGIDAVRSLKNFLWQKPINSKIRVVIVNEAENLTSQAQNAALKIAEEPPESALIIFIIKKFEVLLPALISRFQKIDFPEKKSNSNYVQNNVNDLIEAVLSRRETAFSETEIDAFFENLIGILKKDSVKNSQQIKEALKRLVLIKRFNVNKRLQLKAI